MTDKIYIVEIYPFYEASQIEYVSNKLDKAYAHYLRRLQTLTNGMGMCLREYGLNRYYTAMNDAKYIYWIEKDNDKIKDLFEEVEE